VGGFAPHVFSWLQILFTDVTPSFLSKSVFLYLVLTLYLFPISLLSRYAAICISIEWASFFARPPGARSLYIASTAHEFPNSQRPDCLVQYFNNAFLFDFPLVVFFAHFLSFGRVSLSNLFQVPRFAAPSDIAKLIEFWLCQRLDLVLLLIPLVHHFLLVLLNSSFIFYVSLLIYSMVLQVF